jgi:PII-like signaling protein
MATQSVTVARIYLREGEHLLPRIMKFLHDEEKVSGVTVLRGIAGFGPDGKIHTSSLIDLSLDLPLIVEFYDDSARMEAVIEHLTQQMKLSHVVSWPATVHTPGTP